jgi:K+-sensing histidine kinase KdpD
VSGDDVRTVAEQQVVSNLLLNAVKYTEPGGRISVALDGMASTITLRVVDTGQGIAAEARRTSSICFHRCVRMKARVLASG